MKNIYRTLSELKYWKKFLHTQNLWIPTYDVLGGGYSCQIIFSVALQLIRTLYFVLLGKKRFGELLVRSLVAEGSFQLLLCSIFGEPCRASRFPSGMVSLFIFVQDAVFFYNYTDNRIFAYPKW